MSMFKKSSSCAIYTRPAGSPTPQAINANQPNPAHFKIKRSQENKAGTACVVEVLYPDATNFEGRKIIVYLHPFAKVMEQRELDPHFCDDKAHLSPFARFEPTAKGWGCAILLIETFK